MLRILTLVKFSPDVILDKKNGYLIDPHHSRSLSGCVLNIRYQKARENILGTFLVHV